MGYAGRGYTTRLVIRPVTLIESIKRIGVDVSVYVDLERDIEAIGVCVCVCECVCV